MPLKVRCKGCEKVLNVPDRARGKSVKCPNCETVLKIPEATPAAAAAAPAAAAPAGVPAPAAEPDDFLARVDLRRAADTRVRVCVKCGAEIEDEEVVDCPECGHNVDTGIMSDYIRTKRERRGPDPEEFWGVAWKGSFQFVGKNIPLVIRTGMYWSLFLTLMLMSLFCLGFCTNLPPKLFWMAMYSLFSLGVTGWYWFCSINVIRHTMGPKRSKKMDDLHFDFFQCVALGIKASVWPYVLLFPVTLVTMLVVAIPVAMSGSADLNLVVIFLAIAAIILVSLLVYPLAMVHMSMPYTYKAWTPYHMGISVGKNVLPSLYWFVMALACMLPMALVLGILHFAWDGGLVGALRDLFVTAAELTIWLMKQIAATEKDTYADVSWWAVPIFFAIATLLTWVAVTPLCIISAFPSVFLMRANGYIGLYFRDKLDLVKEQTPKTLCGFWPRYLAFLVDYLILYISVLLVASVAALLIYIVKWADLDYLAVLLNIAFWGFLIVFPWFYFAKAESNPTWRASIGKRALGLIVVEDDGEFSTLTFEKASGRYWIKVLLGFITIYISWLVSAFTEKKQALHDSMLRTLVVWEGDDERNVI